MSMRGSRTGWSWAIPLALVAGILTVVGASPASAVAPTVGVADSMTQVRPTILPAGLSSAASLVAAGNEYESFQLVVSGPATGVSVSGDLFGWGTTALHRAAYYNAVQRSDTEGGTGLWADALIPEEDTFYGENRTAFPFDVPAGENRVVWVDVFVPPGTPAGYYNGSLSVSSAGGTTVVPVAMEALNWAMPVTSTMDNLFMVQTEDGGGNSVCLAHTGSKTCNGNTALRAQLNSMYTRLGLENRMTTGNGFGTEYGLTSQSYAPADWENYLEGPTIRGGAAYPATADFHLSGPQPTRVAAYTYADFHCLTACADQWEAEATEAAQSWADKMIWYGSDEPGNNATTWASHANYLGQARAGWDRPALVNATIGQYTTYAPPSMDADVISTYVNLMQPYGGASIRPQYDAWLAGDPGREVWLATACDASGCGPGDTTSPVYDGLPGYAIDAPANQARAMPWIVDAYDATGELNWSTTKRLATAWNVDGQFESGMNGDGTMYYPGTTARIGGAHDIPLESVRLKRLRDGREDWEYMHFLRANGRGSEVDSIVASVYPNGRSATAARDGGGPGSLLSARTQLVDLVREVTGPGSRHDGSHLVHQQPRRGPRDLQHGRRRDRRPADDLQLHCR